MTKRVYRLLPPFTPPLTPTPRYIQVPKSVLDAFKTLTV